MSTAVLAPRRAWPRRALRAAVRLPGRATAVLFMLLVAAWAVLPGPLATHDPLRVVPADRLQPPSAAHLFGTDELGRDLYSRVVHGTALSLQSTLAAVLIGLALGSVLGLLAGFARGVVDAVVMRLVDVLLAVPSLLLSLVIVAALGPGTAKIACAVGIGSMPGFARVVRAEVLRVRASGYVEAATVVGARRFSIVLWHVVPNAAGPAIVLATTTIGTAMLAISSLGFLGFGAPPPAPEWGSLIAGGRGYLATAWWISLLPCLVVVLSVLAVNHLARTADRARVAGVP
ncbi:ABC transporter permease [Phytohabitans sp. ZYX-F-186]|uniref:ABC transporter permease n=1 Tax=Phytohabitans maris TaxID=3071409 RepID=A0ABU0ZDK0_9ACTN|nr:ABC transporter permease [Phytohabitans sp. ZYX-F-186]MDQ7905134.1 ABC transporter permease [Phytohabitans sp. ZYX-F-186]